MLVVCNKYILVELSYTELKLVTGFLSSVFRRGSFLFVCLFVFFLFLRHDITEISLKVALNSINHKPFLRSVFWPNVTCVSGLFIRDFPFGLF